MKINIDITMTFSKFLSILILIAGTAYAFIRKDSAVMITTLTISGALTGAKTIKGGSDGKDKIRSDES